MPGERVKQIRMESKDLLKTIQPGEDCMIADLTLSELEGALRTIKSKKAPGADVISGDMLKHLGVVVKKTLLSNINQIWKAGTVPKSLKMAHIIPILKKRKNKLLPNSYQPISLLICVCRLLERIVNRRQLWYLESHGLISSTQTGNRNHRSTEDQLSPLAQEVDNGFQDKNKTIAVFFDFTQAFDRVWKDGLLLKLQRKGIWSKLFSWIKNLLVHISARVMADGTLSHRAHLREGVPQGGVIYPALFLVFIDDITDCVPRHVSNTLHADDYAVWSTTIHTNTAVKRIQGTVDNVDQWTKGWGHRKPAEQKPALHCFHFRQRGKKSRSNLELKSFPKKTHKPS
jgi:hypothetical protein